MLSRTSTGAGGRLGPDHGIERDGVTVPISEEGPTVDGQSVPIAEVPVEGVYEDTQGGDVG